MEELSFIKIIIIIIVSAFSIVVVRVGVKFDLNKFLERRDKKLLQKLQNNCTHMAMEYDKKNDNIIMKGLFYSPSGTLMWQCQRCGLIKQHVDEEEHQRKIEYYLNHIDEYNKQEKKFNKILKKMNVV